jgi:hypothetical protein
MNLKQIKIKEIYKCYLHKDNYACEIKLIWRE